MDISVRSPHGDADVSVDADDTTTLAELVVAVTGQAVPRLLLVDGRPKPGSTPLLHSGARIGSVLSVENRDTDAVDADSVRLVQLAGPGTGRTARLEPGRYLLGPARRLSDHELRAAAVESAAFELEVATDRSVRLTAVDDDVRIGHENPREPAVLGDRAVSTATRAFVIDSGPRDPLPPVSDGVGPDGHVLINRPPGSPTTTPMPRRPVLDALETAALRTPALWARRSDGDAAEAIPVGITVGSDGDWRSVTIPLVERTAGVGGVGVVGSEVVRSGLARALLVELAVACSPAELRIVIVTANPGAWEWAKWLPHVREHGRPTLLRPDDVDGRLTGADIVDGRATVVVVDDPAAWMHADGALRGRWSDLPPATTVVALCSTRSEVPSVCTLTLDEQRSGRVSLSGTRRTTVPDVLPAVADADTAEQVARHLAPLVDGDDAREDGASTIVDWALHCDIADDAGASAVRDRWAQQPAVTTPSTVLVRSNSLQSAVDVASGLTVDLALRRPPAALRILAVTDRDTALLRLPHSEPRLDLVGPDGSPSLAAVGVDRFARRLRSMLDAPAGPEHVVIVASNDRDAPGTSDDVLAELTALAAADVTVIVATDDERPVTGFVPSRTIDVTESPGRFELRIDDDAGPRTLAIARPRSSRLDVRAFVHGRHPTPTERRIDHRRARHVDPVLERLVRLAADAATPPTEAPSLVPTPRSRRLELAHLLDRAPGDAVPLGLLDRPERDEDDVWWWRPDTDSILAVGDPSAHTRLILRTLLVGIDARFGDADLGVITLTPTNALRTMASALPQSLMAIDHTEVTDDTADEIERLLGQHTTPVVILIDDLPALRRCARLADVDGWIRGLVARPGVVATAGDAASIEEAAVRFASRLIGVVAPTEAIRLGVAEPPTEPSHAIVLPSEAILVLATVADDDEPSETAP